ncbi:MAG TPA: DUF1656 domain-containing protein [Stenotrophomonas sp.]|jgi:hypothetical protein
MPPEIALGGTLVPAILLLFIAMLAVFWSLDWVAGRYQLYRYVWHPSLFRIAVFLILFSSLALLLL